MRVSCLRRILVTWLRRRGESIFLLIRAAGGRGGAHILTHLLEPPAAVWPGGEAGVCSTPSHTYCLHSLFLNGFGESLGF